MDDRLKRKLLCHYIADKTSWIEPRPRSLGLGNLTRLFDDLNGNELESFMPAYMLKHIEKLDQAIQTDTLKLWSLSLAMMISCVMSCRITHELRNDIQQALGLSKYHRMKQLCKDSAVDPKEIERALCRGFASAIFQYFYDRIPTPILQKINCMLSDIDYLDTDLLRAKRKKCLIKNLKIDIHNPEHLAFWQAHTFTSTGPFSMWGKPVTLEKRTFRIPHRIEAMMQVPDTHYGSFGDFKEVLDEVRQTPIGWFPAFKQKYRDEITSQIYDCIDLEMINLNQTNRPKEAEKQVKADQLEMIDELNLKKLKL